MRADFLRKGDFLKTSERAFAAAGLAGAVSIGLGFFWMGYAPLTTSVTVSGVLASSQPIIPLQTSVGGQVAETHLRSAEVVTEGQLLLRFDTTSLREEIASIDVMLDVLSVDLGELPKRDSTEVEAARLAVATRVAAHTGDIASLMAEIAAATSEANRLEGDILAVERKVALAKEAMDRKSNLVSRGVVPESELSLPEQDWIDAKTELNRLLATIASAQERQKVLEAQIDATVLGFAAESSARKKLAYEQKIQLELRRQGLVRDVEASTLHAPSSGTLVDAYAISKGQVFAAGEILAQIAVPVESFEIHLIIPTRYIDQVSVGQGGTVVLSGLPQRGLPRIGVVVTALAGAIQNDVSGNPVGYAARGLIDASDLTAAKHALGGDLRLQRDMPVQVMLEGHTSTVLSYLARPIYDMINRGTEDG